jgi:hypothetical protein
MEELRASAAVGAAMAASQHLPIGRQKSDARRRPRVNGYEGISQPIEPCDAIHEETGGLVAETFSDQKTWRILASDFTC